MLASLMVTFVAASILLSSWKVVARPNDRAGSKFPVSDHGFYSWIIERLFSGRDNVLTDHDLPPLEENLKASNTRRIVIQAWREQRSKCEHSRSLWLPYVLARSFRRSFLLAIPFRLIMTICRYCQPVLISTCIQFAASELKEARQGQRLILSAVAVYAGFTISTALYQHYLSKLKFLPKSAVIGLLHDKIMNPSSPLGDHSRVISLVATDLESLSDMAEMFHETWAQLIEVIIGTFLLARHVGWLWPLPLFLIYLSSHVSRFVARHLQPRQHAWNNASQDRILVTEAVLVCLRNIKLLGLQQSLARRLDELRATELRVAAKLRWVLVYYNASANALGILSPVLTLILYTLIAGFRGSILDAQTAFSTIAVLGMVTHPANMITTVIPRAVALQTNLQRIEADLLDSGRDLDLELCSQSARAGDPSNLAMDGTDSVITQDLYVAILRSINLRVRKGSLTVVTGATGSGKSTLLRVFAGALDPTAGKATVSSKHIAYCQQQPWLPIGTIREVICGFTPMHDEKWYQTVLQLCCLDHDLRQLPHGDATQVGSRGSKLSGGQRQRVALARAVFAHCELLLFDDTFSGLDGDTGQRIFENLLAPTGLLRRPKATIILATSAPNILQGADHVIVLESGKVKTQGPWSVITASNSTSGKYHASARESDSNHPLSPRQGHSTISSEPSDARGHARLKTYAYYLHFAEASTLLHCFSSIALYAFFMIFQQHWLRLWTEFEDAKHIVLYTGGFVAITVAAWVATSVQTWSFLIRLAPESGLRLHMRLLQITMSAPTTFLSHTTSSRILSAFTRDLQAIDKQLPAAIQTTSTQICKLVMQILLLYITSKWLAVSLLACTIIAFAFHANCSRLARQLRRMEATSRCQLLSSFTEHIEGIETIRAFGWGDAAIKQNTERIDSAHRHGFLLSRLRTCSSFVLDSMSGTIAVACISTTVMFPSKLSGAKIGMALNVLLVAHPTLRKLYDSWTLEDSIAAVERLKTLEETIPDEHAATTKLTIDSPRSSDGRIEFRNVSASYDDGNPVLRALDFRIKAGAKVVICGRTGSGKSTILALLLRLLELQTGQIFFDGVNIRQLPLNVLRRKAFVTISQDPFILANETLRFNLDPDGTQSDAALVAALSKTSLWQHFRMEFTDSGGRPLLDRRISELREMSAGQRQLLAIARAIVKASALRSLELKPVILLDEITSSLDADMEELVLRIIDDEFTANGHTVIMITHNLRPLCKQLVVGRDQVVVLADGAIENVYEVDSNTFEYLLQKQ